MQWEMSKYLQAQTSIQITCFYGVLFNLCNCIHKCLDLCWVHTENALDFKGWYGGYFRMTFDLQTTQTLSIFLCIFFYFYFQHTSRRFHDLDGNLVKSDSGIWINGFDYNGISHITPHIPEINDTIRTPCEEWAPFCGLPWILPVHFMFRLVWTLLCLSICYKAHWLCSLCNLTSVKDKKNKSNLGLKVNYTSLSADAWTSV